jgi:hypothetical protein
VASSIPAVIDTAKLASLSCQLSMVTRNLFCPF